MCLAKTTLPNGTEVTCRKCWQCQERKIDDWVGRCIAEGKTSTAAFAVTLTYGRDRNYNVDHMNSLVLTYSDVQKYFKKLRADGYQFRYLVTGEYGTLKGRAHWHVVLFFQNEPPKVELQKRFMQKHWTHGVSYWEENHESAVRYNCKYILKDTRDEAQGHMSMSKKPPLGTQWFRELAEQYVQQGLAPQSPMYTHSDVKRRANGEVKQFMMRGAVERDFLEHYLKEWKKQRGGHHPTSEYLTDWLDKRAPEDIVIKLEPKRRKVFVEKPKPPSARKGVKLEFCQKFGTWYFNETVAGQTFRVYWTYDKYGTERIWQSVVRTKTGKRVSVDRRREIA